MDLHDKKIGFIGGGAMAEALISGLLNANLVLGGNIMASDINPVRLNYLEEKFNIKTTNQTIEVAEFADIIILAVKPFVVPKVVVEISPVVNYNQFIISIAAGIKIKTIEDALERKISVIRVMPNTPSLIGEGASAYSLGSYATPEQGEIVSLIFNAVGRSVHVNEELIDSVTGLSGSGPAYMFVIMESFADAGVRVGLPRDTALILAAQTMLGAAKMVLETGEHPGKLKDMVTTPGGTTITGLHAMEEGNIRATIMNTVLAATNRSREMGRESKD